MRTTHIIASLILLIAASCTNRPHDAAPSDSLPPIFPDYIGVTIPAEIAPLNFNIIAQEDEDVEAVDVTVRGSKGGELHTQGQPVAFDTDEWHRLTQANRGGSLTLTVCVRQDGRWTRYRDFNIYVSPHPLKDYGLTYRRIAPGYEVYGRMGIYQRQLGSFDESPILENTSVPGACMNCHTANRTNPDRMTFHIRGDHGATLIQQHGRREWLKARNDSIKGSLVYPYWHPSGRYCAYSTNNTHQSFHSVANERIEVFDQSSDVMVYSPSTHSLILDPRLMTPDHYETYPVFSADGKTLYYCAADTMPIPARYREIRYNLCRISFDAATGRFGQKVDTIVNARRMGKSVAFPRPSYDGRYIMFTLSDYGTFPIWHKEADLWLMDLRTGKLRPLTACNSSDTESFHNWSSDSRWFVFASRRGDGLYTRLYLSSIDDKGRATKPFLLPQKNPWQYYDRSIYSFNVPDFTAKKVGFDHRAAALEIESDKRTETKVR